MFTASPVAQRRKGWRGNNKDTLIIVATLITTLSYQMRTNIPGGYWRQDGWHNDMNITAGDPIMRDRDRIRYWMFMTSSWTGFASSMLMTICLLSGIGVNSFVVKWPFMVAYSSLVLNFITVQMRTLLGVNLLLWVMVVLILWLIILCSHRYSGGEENTLPANSTAV